MPDTTTAQQHIARAYAWVDDQVGSDDIDTSQRAAAVALELYAAAAELAADTGRVELIPDQPSVSDADAADALGLATDLLGPPDPGPGERAARHLTAARTRLLSDGTRP